ncbi:uncharacterized protein LOC133180590 [Saccostrea echinata]|uniref:uncharacterized protein LOC133180590 n=1 Tax=Saccostrea echinata TaxID=191078 RepID=UPI002A81EF9E|nr:uncharacterized protein LOC133180590 [Saccostrea echinata]
MSALGSTSDVSLTSSLLQDDTHKPVGMRFTLEELAALSGTSNSSSTSYQHNENPYSNANTLLRTIRQKGSTKHKDYTRKPQDPAKEVLRVIRKKGHKGNNENKDTKPRAKNAQTQTEREIEDIIRELEEIEKHADTVSGRRNCCQKPSSPVTTDNDLKMANDLLNELDKEIFPNKYTQTNTLSDKAIYKEIINFSMPRRHVQSRTDHCWPKGHKLHLKFDFNKKY